MSYIRKLRRDLQQWPTDELEPPTIREIDSKILELLLKGPDESMYADYKFNLIIHIPEDYPSRAPLVRFTTPILHPAISLSGEICKDSITWKTTMPLHQYIKQIEHLLTTFDTPSPLNAEIDVILKTNEVRGRIMIRDAVHRYAIPIASPHSDATHKPNPS
jgi:ubiquitin-protein ligase